LSARGVGRPPSGFLPSRGTVLSPLVHMTGQKSARADPEPPVHGHAPARAEQHRIQVKLGDLRGRSRSREIVLPRQIAMFLVKELTHASLPEIGRAFGGKHHTTVIHSINKIEAQRGGDPDLNKMIHSLIDSFQ